MRLRDHVAATDRHSPVRVLHVLPSVSSGGIESLVVSLWESVDRSRIHFDIAALNPTSPVHQERVERLGASVHFIADAGVRSNLLSKIAWRVKAPLNFATLLFRERYDVVHCHLGVSHTPFTLVAALRRVPIRIVHAHTAGTKRETATKCRVRRLRRVLGLECLVTHRVGCSDAACTWLWGEQAVKVGRTHTLYNGIDTSRFSPCGISEDRGKRRELGGCTRFLHVGRYSEVKNQSFLLDVFALLRDRLDSVHLNIVGFGRLENDLRRKAQQLGLSEAVSFLERDTDVAAVLAETDYFLLPSLHEGFGIVAVEAQAAGVPVFVSDSVTREIDMGMAEFIPLEIGAVGWVERILNAIEEGQFPSECSAEQLRRFDIKEIAKQWETLYETGELGQPGAAEGGVTTAPLERRRALARSTVTGACSFEVSQS